MSQKRGKELRLENSLMRWVKLGCMLPEVKKWTRNKHAIMFQLSNKIVQAAD